MRLRRDPSEACERELLDWERRASERRVKDARFRAIRTLDTFNFSGQASINEALIRELNVGGEYINRRENVLLVGNPGTGKTHLAFAQGRRVKFSTTTALVAQLQQTRENRRLQRYLKQMERLDLLILYELGYVPFSKTGAELLFEVVSRAYERTNVVVTTNLPFDT
ncbi:MAG: ATP-binding protein [Verrucomicrobiota bacterium]